MLDELIHARAGASRPGARLRIARGVQTVARVLVIPALASMLVGLVVYLVGPNSGAIPGGPVIPIRRIASAALFTPAGGMSLGLLLLALIPFVSVLLILVERVRSRQWGDAVVALGVAAILLVSMVLVPG